jgi:hypothetical protein
MFATYSPNKIQMVWNAIPMLAFMDGSFVTVERTADGFTRTPGAHGDVTRVQSHDRGGSVTVSLMWQSPTNDLLSAAARTDELYGTETGPLLVKDLNGTSLFTAEVAWIRKVPTSEFGTDAPSREWIFDCAEIEMLVGSATTL